MPSIPKKQLDLFVIADASPLRYLILIDEIELLQQLYGTIAVPEAVVRELSNPKTPQPVRSWIASMPAWVNALPDEGPSYRCFQSQVLESVRLWHSR